MKVKVKYEKPTLQKVKLVPSEAVLLSCKTAGATGPDGSFGCLMERVSPCSTIGS